MLEAKMEKRVKGRKLTLKLWDRIIGLSNAFFNFFIYKMLKKLERLEREFSIVKKEEDLNQKFI